MIKQYPGILTHFRLSVWEQRLLEEAKEIMKFFVATICMISVHML